MTVKEFQKIVPLILSDDNEIFELGLALLPKEIMCFSDYIEYYHFWHYVHYPNHSMKLGYVCYIRKQYFPWLIYSPYSQNFI